MLTSVRTATLLVCTLTSVSAGDTTLDAVFQRIDKAAATFKGVTGDIRRVKHMQVINADDAYVGTFVMRKSKAHEFQYLLKQQQPEEEIVQLTGTKVQLYTKKNNTVQVGDLGKQNRSTIEQFLTLGFGNTSADLQASYTVTLTGAETINGQAATRLLLIPKSVEVKNKFPKIDMWVSDALGIAIQHKLYEPGADYQLNTYSNLKLRDSITDAELKLDLPKDVHREAFSH